MLKKYLNEKIKQGGSQPKPETLHRKVNVVHSIEIQIKIK